MAFSILTRAKIGLKKILRYLRTEPRPETEPEAAQEPEVDGVPELERTSLLTDDSSLFPLFSVLPSELQVKIWEAASELDEVGICVPRINPDHLHDIDPLCRELESDGSKISESQPKLDVMVERLVVNFKLPPVFHICRQSRQVARKAVLHSEDKDGACYGAFREYDPAKDVFFVTHVFFHSFFPFKFWEKAKEIKHVGLEYPTFNGRWSYFMSCWNLFIAHHQTPKLTIIVKTPRDGLYLGPRNQIYQVQKLFTARRNAMTFPLQIWHWQYNHANLTALQYFRPGANDMLEVTFGTLKLSGSEPPSG
ncbi:uncharacterized protein F4807DRAFT_195818 [Annulohypoxylon truncatum]|uniref:uncharacterized protein n=1 Tax=Annulohypoxylon truncatum TaxID=327061 RepID=UPI002008E00B|nr:uncharacterized protein F4807DRAFT_195818 [Annulohypoxylon truncatum]KAI1213667.1 hypothetical protein F4807DRAFT_195818 [Annulohypoxylon truncatum]